MSSSVSAGLSLWLAGCPAGRCAFMWIEHEGWRVGKHADEQMDKWAGQREGAQIDSLKAKA